MLGCMTSKDNVPPVVDDDEDPIVKMIMGLAAA